MISIILLRIVLPIILPLHFSMTAEAMSVFLDIDVDGSVANESYVPRCEKDKGIKVDLYEFLNRTCYPDSICLVEGRGELSILAVYNLYESCSMKHVCQNMSFPVVDIQAGGYNTVFVQYQCYDKDETTSFLTSLLIVCVVGVIAINAGVIIVIYRWRCKHREGKDQYIEPVYKPFSDNNTQLQQSNTANFKHQEVACGSSSSFRDTQETNQNNCDGNNKSMGPNLGDRYYLELEDVPMHDYAPSPESNAIYEQISQNCGEKEMNYTTLDSDKSIKGTLLCAIFLQAECTVEVNKFLDNKVITGKDGYLQPVVN